MGRWGSGGDGIGVGYFGNNIMLCVGATLAVALNVSTCEWLAGCTDLTAQANQFPGDRKGRPYVK